MRSPHRPAPLLPITSKQMRDARGLLGRSRDGLAAQSETTVGFISDFEDMGQIGTLLWHPKKFDTIRTALEQAGVTFASGDESRLKLKRPPE